LSFTGNFSFLFLRVHFLSAALSAEAIQAFCFSCNLSVLKVVVRFRVGCLAAFYEQHHFMDHSAVNMEWFDLDEDSCLDDEESQKPWPIPSKAKMLELEAHRESMRLQTEQNRRLNPHKRDERSILFILRDREINGMKHTIKKRRMPISHEHEIRLFGEYYSITRFHAAFLDHLGGKDQIDESGLRPTSSLAVSTISVAFSSDSHTMASTHGDHTVKITCCATGFLLATLEGHPRTPWTVKYHPLQSNILASGCLGFQVRVWDWKRASCLHMIRLNNAIISLSFHPGGHILAIASGSSLHFWDFGNYNRREGNGANVNGARTEIDQSSMLRCVHFTPNGKSIIVGGVNPNFDEHQRPGQARGVSFYLKLWDFDFDAALHPSTTLEEDIRSTRRVVRLQRKPLTNVSRKLLGVKRKAYDEWISHKLLFLATYFSPTCSSL
jgi:hypothetical protein